MGTAGEFLDECRSHLGFVEGPRDNETPFGAARQANFQPWCASFVSFWLNQTGSGHGRIVYVPAIVANYRAEGRLFTTPQPGDLMCLWFPSKNRTHTSARWSRWTVTSCGQSRATRTRPALELGDRSSGSTADGVGPAQFSPVLSSPPVTFQSASKTRDRRTPCPSRWRDARAASSTCSPMGGVFPSKDLPFLGSLPDLKSVHGFPIVAAAWTPSGEGYWLVAPRRCPFRLRRRPTNPRCARRAAAASRRVASHLRPSSHGAQLGQAHRPREGGRLRWLRRLRLTRHPWDVQRAPADSPARRTT